MACPTLWKGVVLGLCSRRRPHPSQGLMACHTARPERTSGIAAASLRPTGAVTTKPQASDSHVTGTRPPNRFIRIVNTQGTADSRCRAFLCGTPRRCWRGGGPGTLLPSITKSDCIQCISRNALAPGSYLPPEVLRASQSEPEANACRLMNGTTRTRATRSRNENRPQPRERLRPGGSSAGIRLSVGQFSFRSMKSLSGRVHGAASCGACPNALGWAWSCGVVSIDSPRPSQGLMACHTSVWFVSSLVPKLIPRLEVFLAFRLQALRPQGRAWLHRRVRKDRSGGTSGRDRSGWSTP